MIEGYKNTKIIALLTLLRYQRYHIYYIPLINSLYISRGLVISQRGILDDTRVQWSRALKARVRLFKMANSSTAPQV